MSIREKRGLKRARKREGVVQRGYLVATWWEAYQDYAEMVEHSLTRERSSELDSERLQAVYSRHWRGGMTLQEVAEKMHCDATTVRRRLMDGYALIGAEVPLGPWDAYGEAEDIVEEVVSLEAQPAWAIAIAEQRGYADTEPALRDARVQATLEAAIKQPEKAKK